MEEQQHTHVLVQGEQERQDILLGALAANPAIVHIIYLQVLVWQELYTRALVQVVLEVQVILLDVQDVHRVIVHILYLEVLV